MMNAKQYPTTLMEAVKFFSDESVALDFFVKLRWPTGVCCPHCGSTDVHFLANQRRWKCATNHPKRQFSAKVGTIFEESPLGLDKWLVAVWLETNAKNSISSYEVARALGITQKSAWFLLHRVRYALHVGSFDKFTGEVESDESYIGGLAKNMHASKRREKIKATGGIAKAIVHGILQRGDKKSKKHSKVIASVIPDAKLGTLLPILRKSVQQGTNLYTDSAAAYKSLDFSVLFVHEMVDHAQMYVKDRCHTNGLENFWSLFRRCIRGTHVNVEPFHIQAYIDSEMFRFNNREVGDGQRFMRAMDGVTGKRLTYVDLIGGSELEGRKASGNTGASGSDLQN